MKYSDFLESIASTFRGNIFIKQLFRPLYRFLYKIQVRQAEKDKSRENSNFIKYGLDALKMFDKVLTENGYKYSLAFGTMLGAIREKGFIKHDMDIDTFMWIEDFDERLIEALTHAGFKRKFSYSIEEDKYGKELSMLYKGVNIDIFFFYKGNDELPYVCDFIAFPGVGGSYSYCAKKMGGLLPRRIHLPMTHEVKRVPFEDLSLPVPVNAEEILSFRYGPDYMIPNPSWSMRDKNVYTFEWPEKLGVFIEYKY